MLFIHEQKTVTNAIPKSHCDFYIYHKIFGSISDPLLVLKIYINEQLFLIKKKEKWHAYYFGGACPVVGRIRSLLNCGRLTWTLISETVI